MAIRPLTLTRLRGDPMMLCVTMLFAGRFVAAMLGADLAYQQVMFLTIGLLALRPPPAPALAPTVEADAAPEAWPGPYRRRGHA
jgi:hypothetical protein